MKHSFLAIAAIVIGLAALPVVFARSAGAAAPTACTSTAKACTESVLLGSGPARSRVYRTYPLKKRNPRIRRALIMVHGALRNADTYFRTATAAAFLAHALADTVVIAPKFASADGHRHDKLAPHKVIWPCSGDSWRSGGVSPTNKNLTSFDFMDVILRELTDKHVFPNLSAIVIAGHSAGGQFVDRYAMANKVDGTLGVAISYVFTNPSSMARCYTPGAC
jgi:pimeloyl-ACP methyl ester carboxylesterase